MISTLKDLVWGMPTLVLLLVFGIYFSLKTRFFMPKTTLSTCKRLLKSLKSGGGSGEISPLASIATALGGTVGVGSILGVGYAIAVGGEGSIFWMWVCSFFGMGLKYAEVKIASAKNGGNGGAPFRLDKLGYRKTALTFAVLCILASFGTGNITQTGVMGDLFSQIGFGYFFSAVITVGLVFLAVFGGQGRIAKINRIIIPLFAGFYIFACVSIIITHRQGILTAFKSIFAQAFGFSPMVGGFSGAVMANTIREGFARSLFSNESGMGSSPLAHGASAEKDDDIRGRWGLFEIFFDTFIISTLTAICLISANQTDMSAVFESLWGEIGKWLFLITVGVLAFASVISWCFYGKCCLEYIFPRKEVPKTVYGVIFALFSALGIYTKKSVAWEISDILNALMMMPNLFLLYKCRKEIERIK